MASVEGALDGQAYISEARVTQPWSGAGRTRVVLIKAVVERAGAGAARADGLPYRHAAPPQLAADPRRPVRYAQQVHSVHLALRVAGCSLEKTSTR